jgi:ribose transport system permease protein
MLSYVVSAMFAGFTGMLGAGYMQSAKCQIFDGYSYDSLIAVIVGGTAFTGGVGTYTGSIAGSLLMVVLSNMLTVLNLSQPIRNLVLGGILVLLLLLYNRKKPVRL